MNKNENGVIIVKSLNNAEFRFKDDNGCVISANVRFNHHIIHVKYFRYLPEYTGYEKVQITDNIVINEHWYIPSDKLKKVRDELEDIFIEALIDIMLSL